MKYFLHKSDAFEDEKITELFMGHGYEGLGMFYTMLEKFAKHEKPIRTAVLKMQLHITTPERNKVWKAIEELGLIYSVGGESFNENILNSAKKYHTTNEKNREKVANWREKQKSNTDEIEVLEDPIDVANDVTGYETVTLPDCNPPKEKKSKENKSKVTAESEEPSVEKATTLFTKCKKTYEEFYTQKKQTAYYFQAVDGAKLKSIIKKIEFVIKQQKEATNGGIVVESLNDGMVFDAFNYYITGSHDADQWISDNFSLSNLDSKFNDLIAKLKNIKQNGTSKRINSKADTGLSASQRAARLYGSDN